MADQDMNKELIDTVIKYAAAREVEDIAAEYAEGVSFPAHAFSKDFNRKMKSFFAKKQRKEKGRRTGKWLLRACAAMFILIVVAAVTIYSVDAFRVPVLNFLREVTNKEITYYSTDTVDYSGFEDQIHGLYVPRYIPTGYELSDLKKDYDVVLEYKNTQIKSKVIKLVYIKGNSTTSIDNEGVRQENIQVNGEKAELLIGDKLNYLIFKYDKQTFLLTADLSKEEMVKIAESMHFNK